MTKIKERIALNDLILFRFCFVLTVKNKYAYFYPMVIVQLKSELEHKIGFRLDSIAACRRFEQILINQNLYVSYTTLSRIFGLALISANARSSTLDELANFLGYIDYDSFRQSHSEQQALYRMNIESQLILDSMLMSGNEMNAVDYLLELRETSPTIYKIQTQTLARHFFGHKIPAKEGICHLLSIEPLSIELLQFFVFEDDPFGHYENALARVKEKNVSNNDLALFHQLFSVRKNVLQGNKKMTCEEIPKESHYHLISRSFELDLLINNLHETNILNITEDILLRINEWKDVDLPLSYVGRWCRGLIYTNRYLLLKDHMEWKQQCIKLLQNQEINKEFQSVIYTFLVLTYGYHGSLEFMFKGNWENAKLESKLMLSLAFNKKEAFKTYKRVLGYV